ncbi:MAG: acylphosphatase, partial [Thaumarchaeota archaeon]
LSWCWVGPAGARVTNIDVEWEEYLGEYDNFRVLY